jgi:hypothetical protein
MISNFAQTTFAVPTNPILISKNIHEGCSELTKKVNPLGAFLRDTLFYPLHRFQEAAGQAGKDYQLLQQGETYYNRFWTAQEPFDLNLENADFIRQNYVVKDQPVIISLYNGKKITSLCRIIETKNCPQDNVFNAVLVPGNLSKLNNNLMPFYDFLVSHSKSENPSPMRLMIFGHYEMSIEADGKTFPYKPPTLDAAGEVLKRTIEALQNKFGKINFFYGHSLGCIILSSLLKRSGPELLPALLHFDRGPSSLNETSQNYWFGWLLNLIGKYSGLAFNINKEIKKFFKRSYEIEPLKVQKSGCLISGVEEDFYFPGKSNLAINNTLHKLQRMKVALSRLMFFPPLQMGHSRAFHGWRLMQFNKSYVTAASSSSENTAMLPNENLAQMALRFQHLLKN